MNVLTAEHIVVERDGRRVVDGVSLALGAGDCAVLAGPNGAGKSTLLRALAGLLPLRSGTLRRPPGSRPPCVVFDQGGLVSGLTVAENIALPLVRARVPASRIAARLGWALTRFDLAAWEAAPGEQMTRGLAVRVQLARAALMEPDVILCDGALDTLDPDAAAEIERLLLRAVAAGTAVLLATNAPERTQNLGAAVWRMDQGRVTTASNGA